MYSYWILKKWNLLSIIKIENWKIEILLVVRVVFLWTTWSCEKFYFHSSSKNTNMFSLFQSLFLFTFQNKCIKLQNKKIKKEIESLGRNSNQIVKRMFSGAIFWDFVYLTHHLWNIKTCPLQNGEYKYMYSVIHLPADTRKATHKIMTFIVKDLSR